MKRTSPLPLLVIVAVLALVLGSLGTAVAGPALTKGKVKQIAAKVVQKSAPGLSVTNAANLAGKPAAAYQDNASAYTTTITSPVTSVVITVPIGPGTYHVSYGAYLSGASASRCWLEQYQGTTEFLNLADDSGAQGVSGSGVVTIAVGQVLKLQCAGDLPFTTYSAVGITDPIQIVVTPLDSVATGTLPYSRGHASRGDGR